MLKDVILNGRGASWDRRAIEQLGTRLLPRNPTSLIAAVRVPPPQLLDPRLDATERVQHLADVYRRVAQHKRGRDMWAHTFSPFASEGARGKRGKRERQGRRERFNRISLAADLLVERSVPPAAWCWWSFDEYPRTKWARPEGIPKVAWVWSSSRLSNSLAFFWADMDQRLRGRIVLAPKHKALLRDWQDMWGEIELANAQTREDLARIVDAFFPGSAFENRVRDARAERDRMQHEISAAGDCGCLLHI